MIQKKKRKRLSFTPTGTPGAGPGWHRSASLRGSGRLGSALKRSGKNAAATPGKPERPKARALGEPKNEVAKVDAASPPTKSSKTKAKKGNTAAKKGGTKSGGKSRPRERTGSGVIAGPAPATRSPVGSAKQKRARTAAKHARKKEAGLEGRRIGKASASGKRVQARRDSKQ